MNRAILYLTEARRHHKATLFQDYQQDTQLIKQDSYRSRKWSYTRKLTNQVKDGVKPAGGGRLNFQPQMKHGWNTDFYQARQG